MPAAKTWRSAEIFRGVILAFSLGQLSPYLSGQLSFCLASALILFRYFYPLTLFRQVDPEMPMLNSFVSQALARGAAPYKKPEPKPAPVESQQSGRLESTFRFEPYEAPPERAEVVGGVDSLFAGIGSDAVSSMLPSASKGADSPAASTASSGKVVQDKPIALQVRGKAQFRSDKGLIFGSEALHVLVLFLSSPSCYTHTHTPPPLLLLSRLSKSAGARVAI